MYKISHFFSFSNYTQLCSFYLFCFHCFLHLCYTNKPNCIHMRAHRHRWYKYNVTPLAKSNWQTLNISRQIPTRIHLHVKWFDTYTHKHTYIHLKMCKCKYKHTQIDTYIAHMNKYILTYTIRNGVQLKNHPCVFLSI